jgi:cytochrome bd-type quinol oxidase subunit 2
MASSKRKSVPKNGEWKNKKIALLWTIALIVGALLIMVGSAYLLPGVGRFIPDSDVQRGVGGFVGAPAPPPEGIGEYLALRFVLSTLNIALVVYLLYVYVKDYMRLKSNFTLGLVAFLFSFLLYAISSLPLLYMLSIRQGFASAFSFVPLLFSAVGLLIFVKLSNE